MLIRDLFSIKSPVISFEISPPKKEYPIEVVYDTIEGLEELNPDFISITYGAGGSMGVEGIYLYTMNKPDVANRIIGCISKGRYAVTEEKECII